MGDALGNLQLNETTMCNFTPVIYKSNWSEIFELHPGTSHGEDATQNKPWSHQSMDVGHANKNILFSVCIFQLFTSSAPVCGILFVVQHKWMKHSFMNSYWWHLAFFALSGQLSLSPWETSSAFFQEKASVAVISPEMNKHSPEG